jgi:hypothetical protein
MTVSICPYAYQNFDLPGISWICVSGISRGEPGERGEVGEAGVSAFEGVELTPTALAVVASSISGLVGISSEVVTVAAFS